MSHKRLTGVAAVAAVAALTGCGTTPSAPAAPGSPATSTSAAARPSATTPPAQPVTAAAARTAAQAYFALYGAGQYAAVYPMIAPTARSAIRESVWVRAHGACRNQQTGGMTYKVTQPVLAGDTAVVSVGFAGALASLGSEQVTFTYTGGQWYYQPSNLSVYAHHNIAQAIAALKAESEC